MRLLRRTNEPYDQRPGLLLLKAIGERVDDFFESTEITSANSFERTRSLSRSHLHGISPSVS